MSLMKNLQIKESFSQAVASRNIAQIANIIMALTVLLLAYKVFTQKPIAIVTPPTFTEEFTIQGNKVSDQYKISWAVFVANTIGNTNQRNIEFNKQVVATMLSPNLQENLANGMNRAAELMKTRKITQNYTIQDAVYDPNNDIVYVWGKKMVTAMRQDPITTNWTFELKVEARQGQPRVSYIKQYSGTPKNNELKGKQPKPTPDYYGESIMDVVSGDEIKDVTVENNGLGHKPDLEKINSEQEQGSN